MGENDVTTEAVLDDDLDTFSTDFFGQKSLEEKTAATTAPVEQDDAAASDSTEAQEEADQEDEAEAQEEIPDKPKRKTVQDRIDEVVRQREEIRREATAEVNKLRQELEDFKKNLTDPVKAAPTTSGEPTPDALKADGEPVYALGEFDPQYIRDLTRFTLEQERTKVQVETVEAQRVEAVKQEQQVLQTSWNGKLEVATVEYPDLIEKGQALLKGFDNLDPGYAGYLSTVLMSMDKGPDVLYYLSNHPDEAAMIVNSGAQRATLALGRIEAKFIDADAQKQLAKPRVSKAPPPPAERARGTNGAFITVAGDTEDLDEFSQAFFKKK